MHSLPFDIELRRAQLLTRRSLLGSSTVSLGAFAEWVVAMISVAVSNGVTTEVIHTF